MMHIKVTFVGPGEDGRPQGTTWTTITPTTPTFNPTKFTPVAEQATWKPSFQVSTRNENQESNVILGSVKQDPSGGFVHTFGAPKQPSSPQTASSNHSDNSAWQNYNSSSPSRQDSVNSPSAPRYVQEIIVPSGPVSHQSRSPVRQTSYQSNASQFSPVQQSPQRSSPGVYFSPQNNSYDSRTNGSSGPVYHTVRQTSTPQQTVRQDSVPYQNVRQDSIPYQTSRQESVPYQTQRQDSSAYPNSWNGPSSVQESSPYQTSRQNSWNQPVQHNSPRQESWSNQPSQQNSYQPPRQESWSNSSVGQTSPSYSTGRQDSRSNPPSRPQSVPYQPPSPNVAPGLFSKQNSASPSSPESAVRYDPVASSSTPGFHRQSSVQYQPSPKPFTPADYNPGEPQNQTESCVPKSVSSPYSYGVPGPFARQQSASGSQPWSPGPVESFPTPPPFSPSVEAAGAPWPVSSGLPTPPPPPPPPPAPPVMAATPVVAPPPPPPPPPPPMPSSAGMMQEVPAWKKQIQATKEAKAAAGNVQTPGTPGQELPAALANSMKRDKKPFTYLPGGLDLSEIRSPKMQRRIIANQQHAPPPPSQLGQQVLLQPRQQNGNSGPQQVQNQMERLNLGEGPQPNDRMAAVDAQRRASTDGTPGYPGQSRSFRILQMMTGGDDATDSVESQPSPPKRNEEEEMRFTGIRRPDNPIPSRAFQTLQKMTQGVEADTCQQADPRFGNENVDDARQEDGPPVDIRYKGSYIPGKSFKMLQEMTGAGGTVVPSVLQEKRQQRKPNLHLNINQPQSPVPKQFPQPSVPASQQSSEEVPKMYRGGRIPSQSFKILQAMTGESGDSQGEDGTDM